MVDSNEKTSRKVQDHYSVNASTYRNHYDPENLHTSPTYPAEYFRLHNLLLRLQEVGAKRVLDAGCGEGTPLLKISELGADVRGFDFTAEMITEAKELFAAHSLDPDWVIIGDVEKYDSFSALVVDTLFDVAICFGVLPHVNDDQLALENLRRSVKSGGRVFVEFRNPLFDLITMNRFTHDFIMNELFEKTPQEIKDATSAHLSGVLAMDKPFMRLESEAGKPGYDSIQAKRHNPITVPDLFARSGLESPVIHWYHFHPTLPMLEGDTVAPDAFREAAFKMEKESSDWRGYFLCSAYVVEALVP
ncbi:MAG: class I SAM-dependent methyltransferase [Pseudomonadota bacterium]|nr:class I SAM-dependent methyltransferase [Pseudomonadota bacterium]